MRDRHGRLQHRNGGAILVDRQLNGTFDAILGKVAAFHDEVQMHAGEDFGRVVGPIRASITQTCIVTLEPFESDVTLGVDRTFEPATNKPRKIRDLNDEGEIEIDLESLDPPDLVVDGVLDLGAVICEELALSLDPFPRRPGVEFEGGSAEAEVQEDAETEPSPFAALEALKSRPED